MAKYRDWYFKYWEPEPQTLPNGKQKTVYVYRGIYYQLPERTRRFKALCILAMAFHLACFLYMSFFSSPGGLTPRVNGACLLNLLPLFCCAAAVPALITAPRAMTHRRYHRCIHRMRWAAALAPVILAMQFIFELIYIANNAALRAEGAYLAVLALDLIVSAVCGFILLRMPFPTTDHSDVIPVDD